MEAVQQKQRTHCSVCGSKVVRQDMPYCIYCGNHFAMMEGDAGKKRKETRNMARLAKMPEHEDFEAAMAREFGEGPEFDRWRRAVRSGVIAAVVGLALLAFVGSALLLGALGLLLVLWGTWRAITNRKKQAERLELPLMKRPAVVTDRRSETELRFNTGITTYFFTLEFEDGNEAEFRYPGRGAHTDPLSKGISGIAHTRGQELIEFEQVRV